MNTYNDSQHSSGRCNVYYRSVNGSVNASVELSVTFHSTHGISFLSDTGSSTAPFWCISNTEQHVGLRNTTTYGGRSKNWTWCLFIGTGEKTKQHCSESRKEQLRHRAVSLRQHGFLVCLSVCLSVTYHTPQSTNLSFTLSVLERARKFVYIFRGSYTSYKFLCAIVNGG